MTEKSKREGPLKIELPFDEAIGRAFKVKPPPGGWAAYEVQLKRQKARQRAKRKKTG
jgi:hypothetical protein